MQVLLPPFYTWGNWGSESSRIPLPPWSFPTPDTKCALRGCFQMPRHPSLFSEQKSRPRSSSRLPGASLSCSPFLPWSYLGKGNSPTVKCSAGPCGPTTPTGPRTWPSWPSWCISSPWPSSGKRPAGQTHTGAFPVHQLLFSFLPGHSLLLVSFGELARRQDLL